MNRKPKLQRRAQRKRKAPGRSVATAKPKTIAATPESAGEIDIQALLDNPRPLTVAEVAWVFRVTVQHVRRMIHAGEVPSISVGQSLAIPHAWFKAKLAGNYLGKAGRPPDQRGKWKRSAAFRRAVAARMTRQHAARRRAETATGSALTD